MKTSSFFMVMMLGAALCATPAMAQRGGGSRGGGSMGSSRGSSSMSSSRGGGFSGSSSRGSSFSGSSKSSSSSSSRGNSFNSSSSSSRSYSTPSNSRSYNTPSSNRSSSSSSNSRGYNTPNNGQNYGTPSREGRPTATTRRPGSNYNSRDGKESVSWSRSSSSSVRPGSKAGQRVNNHKGGPDVIHYVNHPYHHATHFHHPHHHHILHMHPIYWDPFPFVHPIYWPGFWFYCNSYWYDYGVRNVTVVREYVKENYNTDLVTYVISDEVMFALTRGDNDKHYLQVFDKKDNMLTEQEVPSTYCEMSIDKDNGGCWLMKSGGEDPLLFFYDTQEGKLLIYEEDR